jgi:selenocysteine lyase/cysteine desulfurase
VAGAVGLGVAIQELLDDQATVFAQLRSCAARVREIAEEIAPGRFEVHAAPQLQSAIIGLELPEPDRVKDELRAAGIVVTTMADYDAPWDYDVHGWSSLLRIAPAASTTEAQLEAFRAALASATRRA